MEIIQYDDGKKGHFKAVENDIQAGLAPTYRLHEMTLIYS